MEETHDVEKKYNDRATEASTIKVEKMEMILRQM